LSNRRLKKTTLHFITEILKQFATISEQAKTVLAEVVIKREYKKATQ